jgi:hypothetical protein
MPRPLQAARAAGILALVLATACGDGDGDASSEGAATAGGATAGSTTGGPTTAAGATTGGEGGGGGGDVASGSTAAGNGSGGAPATGGGGTGGGSGGGASTGGGAPSCEGDQGGLFPPTGFDNVSNTLASRWAPEPIGSALVPFTMLAGVDSSYSFTAADLGFGDDPERVYFTLHSENSAPGAPWGQADYRFVTVSRCPRDLRIPVAGDPDPTLDPGCRAYAGEGQVVVLNFGPPIAGACNLDPDRSYWLNVVLEDPSDGLDPAEPRRCTSMVCGFRMAVL